MVKVIDKEALIEERVKNGYAKPVNMAEDQISDIFSPQEAVVEQKTIVEMKSKDWTKSEAYHSLWNDIHNLKKKIAPNGKKGLLNAAQAPSATELATLISKVFVDITRRTMELPDLTDKIAVDVVNPNYAKVVPVRDFLPYIGEFKEISGTGNNVPLIEQKTGNADSVNILIKALGWETTLENVLFNEIHNLQKVNEAAASAYVDQRNANTIGRIVGATYDSSQSQAVVEVPDSSYDVKMYQTILAGYKKLVGLKDFMTKRAISTAPGVKILCNSADAWAIERVINGQLSVGTNGVFQSQNMGALPIREVLIYDQGVTDGFVFKEKTLSFPGVTAGTAYIFVPSSANWILTKRGLTQEVGLSNPLQTLKEARMWYFADGVYDKFFLGSSNGLGWGSGYGYIVKITLPDSSDNT